jgi:hypothetical protein
LPHEKLREIGMAETTPLEIRVQALHSCANYYAPRLSPATLLPTNIDLPPTDDVPSILAAQSEVVQAMAAGKLEMAAGQVLMNSLALMIRSRESLGVVQPPPLTFDALPDLPGAPGTPTNAEPPAAPPPNTEPSTSDPGTIVAFSRPPPK